MIRPRKLSCSAMLIALLLAAAIAPIAATSAPLSERDVQRAVETWVRRVTADARPDAAIARLEPWVVRGETVAYIAHLEGDGFCLTGADPLLLPVYFYSPHGTYDPANPALRAILDEIEGRLAWSREAQRTGAEAERMARIASERETMWRSLIASQVPERPVVREAVMMPSMLELPMTSTWDQISPYNDQCPQPDPLAEPTLTGCNATATAQIMYWWKWPTQGVGSTSVTYVYRFRSTWDSEPLATDPGIPPSLNGRLFYSASLHLLYMTGTWDQSVYDVAYNVSFATAYRQALANLWSRMNIVTTNPDANFGATTYDWSLIGDVHSDPLDAGDVEVAKFNAHVAIACHTTFGLFGSGSIFGNDVAALENYFRYDTDALFTDMNPGADVASLTEDIMWGRLPGLGGLVHVNAGHAWVLYGYNTATDPNREFKMNFGWGGSENGWYLFDEWHNPAPHDMMTRVAPTSVKFVGAAMLGDGTPSSPWRDLYEARTESPAGMTWMLKAGATYAFNGTIQTPCTINGYGAYVH